MVGTQEFFRRAVGLVFFFFFAFVFFFAGGLGFNSCIPASSASFPLNFATVSGVRRIKAAPLCSPERVMGCGRTGTQNQKPRWQKAWSTSGSTRSWSANRRREEGSALMQGPQTAVLLNTASVR